MCVVVFITCVQAVSLDESEAEKDKTLQLQNDIPCCKKALQALQEAEQKIQTLNNTVLNLTKIVRELVTNQARMNASIETVKVNTSANSKAVANNTNSITTNKNGIANNTKRFSTLTSYQCNCTIENSYYCRDPKKVTTGYTGFCGQVLSNHACYSIRLDDPTKGNRCCNICVGTAEEAEAYAHAHPMPPPDSD